MKVKNDSPKHWTHSLQARVLISVCTFLSLLGVVVYASTLHPSPSRSNSGTLCWEVMLPQGALIILPQESQGEDYGLFRGADNGASYQAIVSHDQFKIDGRIACSFYGSVWVRVLWNDASGWLNVADATDLSANVYDLGTGELSWMVIPQAGESSPDQDVMITSGGMPMCVPKLLPSAFKRYVVFGKSTFILKLKTNPGVQLQPSPSFKGPSLGFLKEGTDVVILQFPEGMRIACNEAGEPWWNVSGANLTGWIPESSLR